MLRFTDGQPSEWRRWIAGLLTSRDRAKVASGARRNRSRRRPVMEVVEDRILLSAVGLRSAEGAADAEVFQAKKSAVLITSVFGNGVKGGMAVLTATLTTAQGV